MYVWTNIVRRITVNSQVTIRVKTKVPLSSGTGVLELGLEGTDITGVGRIGEQGGGVVVGGPLGTVLVGDVTTQAAGLVTEELAGGDEAVGTVGAAKGGGRVGDVDYHVGVGAGGDTAAADAGLQGHEAGGDGA